MQAGTPTPLTLPATPVETSTQQLAFMKAACTAPSMARPQTTVTPAACLHEGRMHCRVGAQLDQLARHLVYAVQLHLEHLVKARQGAAWQQWAGRGGVYLLPDSL